MLLFFTVHCLLCKNLPKGIMPSESYYGGLTCTAHTHAQKIARAVKNARPRDQKSPARPKIARATKKYRVKGKFPGKSTLVEVYCYDK